MLDTRTVAFARDNGEVWLYRRNDTFDSARDVGWIVSADDLPALDHASCSDSGWLPMFAGNKHEWRRDDCRALTACAQQPVHRFRTRRQPAADLTLSLDAWRGVQWTNVRPPSTNSVARHGPTHTMAPEFGMRLAIAGTFDPWQRFRSAQRFVDRHRPIRPRLPLGFGSDELAREERDAVTRLLCAEARR